MSLANFGHGASTDFLGYSGCTLVIYLVFYIVYGFITS